MRIRVYINHGRMIEYTVSSLAELMEGLTEDKVALSDIVKIEKANV